MKMRNGAHLTQVQFAEFQNQSTSRNTALCAIDPNKKDIELRIFMVFCPWVEACVFRLPIWQFGHLVLWPFLLRSPPMTPESFNAALAQRKLDAIDILLVQTKRGSDADRIRAASAILRMAFIPVASASSRCSAQPSMPEPPQQAKGALSASSGGASSTPSAPETPQPPPHVPRNSPELALGAPSMHTNAYPTINPTLHTIIERSLVNSS